jgi:UDP-3-O-[3-hydroxymyristoyl] glucosamine N-acyltransferase
MTSQQNSARSQFFNKKHHFLTIAQIVEITGATAAAEVDVTQKVFDVGTLEDANSEQISFLHSGAYFEKFLQSKTGVCFVEESYVAKSAGRAAAALLTHKNPYFAYAQIAAYFYEEKREEFSVGKLTHPTAEIGEGCVIAPNVYIGANAKIGKNCFIAPGVVIMTGSVIGDNCTINANAVISFAVIGSNCIIHHGTKIGQDGFGFAHDKGVNHKIIQLGIVRIGNKVEIGANSCLDRGAIGDTVIGDDVKIDNLVQIAHNVEIGQGTVIAGCAAVAGSAKIGRFVQIGGKCSIGGHITINDGARIAGMSGLMRDVAPREIVAGIPAVPIRMWHKMNATLVKMVSPKSNN